MLIFLNFQLICTLLAPLLQFQFVARPNNKTGDTSLSIVSELSDLRRSQSVSLP
ncbi:hypothetical protein RYX36_006432, partial [Vicia faba]